MPKVQERADFQYALGRPKRKMRRDVLHYDPSLIAATPSLPMVNAEIRVKTSAKGESAAWLFTEEPGDLGNAATPHILRKVFPEIFGKPVNILQRILNVLPTSHPIPLGFIESARLASGIEAWLSAQRPTSEWLQTATFSPLGFLFYVRSARDNDELLLQDARGEVRSHIYSVTAAQKAIWLQSASILRRWPAA
jgi:hypothetical protein